jgi:hypothetical protein
MSNVIVVVALTFLLASLTTGAMRHTNVRSITCNPNTRCNQNCPISNKCCCNNRIGVNPQCYNDATHDCVTVSGQQAGSFNCLCGQNSGCCQYTSPTGTTRLSCYSTQSHVCVVDSLRTGKYCLCPSGSPVCRNGGCSKATTPVCPVDAPVRCQSATGSSCVNLQSDENNCGTCGNKCMNGEECEGGVCQSNVVCPNDAPVFTVTELQCYYFAGCVSSPSQCCEACRRRRFTAGDEWSTGVMSCADHKCDAYYAELRANCDPTTPYQCTLFGFQGDTCPRSTTGSGYTVSYCMDSL